MGRSARLAIATVVAVTAIGPGCGDDAPVADDDEPAGRVLVFAASSLFDVMAELADAFAGSSPDVDVEVSTASSSSLALSIEEGSPVDVFVAADTETMERLVAQDLLATDPMVVATNQMTIAVPEGNAAGLTSVRDFARDDLLLGACASEVPCGGYADAVFEQAGVRPALDTRAPSAQALVTLVVEGSLDAAIVYRTDLAAHRRELDEVELPADLDVEARYPAAVVADAPNPAAADAFVEFLSSDRARETFERAGFGAA